MIYATLVNKDDYLIGLVQGFTEPIPVSSSDLVMIASEILVHSYGRNQQPYFRKNRS